MRKLVLVGAGHANLRILKNLASKVLSDWEIVLIDENPFSIYSGCVPSWIAGVARIEDIQIDLQSFCAKLGVTFTQGRLVNLGANRLLLSDGKELPFDLLSLNVGSEPEHLKENFDIRSVYLKPFSSFKKKWIEIERICSACATNSFAVVGGGAGGIEVALALSTRFQIRNSKKSRVTLFSSGRLYGNTTDKMDLKIRQALNRNRVQIEMNKKIVRSKDGILTFLDGTQSLERFDRVFLLTTAKAPNWLEQTGLPLDDEGFLKVDPQLRCTQNIFAAGDAVSVQGTSARRSGVRAVRQGEVVSANIERVMNGNQALQTYQPQQKELNILFFDPKTALLLWGKWAWLGRIPRLLKNYIDSKYLKSFER